MTHRSRARLHRRLVELLEAELELRHGDAADTSARHDPAEWALRERLAAQRIRVVVVSQDEASAHELQRASRDCAQLAAHMLHQGQFQAAMQHEVRPETARRASSPYSQCPCAVS